MRFIPCSFLLTILLASCSSSRYLGPSPEAEFRGVWIATVVNIDWPKNADDNVTKQKKDFIDLLEFYQNLNFNAVIVQVRTAGDAFYPTELRRGQNILRENKEGHLQIPKTH